MNPAPAAKRTASSRTKTSFELPWRSHGRIDNYDQDNEGNQPRRDEDAANDPKRVLKEHSHEKQPEDGD